MPPLIELSNYTLPPVGSGNGIASFYFALNHGDVCTIDADTLDDAHTLLRGLATLTYPVAGEFRFKGKRQELSNYRKMLHCKRKIGYIAPDTALISNLSLRQNILIQRYYFENDLTIKLDDKIMALCDTAGICAKLDRRPSELNAMDIQMAIVIREISKEPEMLLLHRPEDYIGHAHFELLTQIFNGWIDSGKPVVFLSYDRRLIRRFANRKILITNGSLTTVGVKRPGEVR